MDRDLPLAAELCPGLARERLDAGALLVDVREHAEAAQVGFDVPQVLHLPLSELTRRVGELPRDRDLVVACQDGERSRTAVRELLALGFAHTGWLEGGLFKWASRGLPLRPGRPGLPTAGAAPGRPAGPA